VGAIDPEPGVPPLLAADQYDFLDRRMARSWPAPPVGSGATGWRFEAARARDRNVGRNVMSLEPAFDDDGNPLRPSRTSATRA
jgi:hypothetical protein